MIYEIDDNYLIRNHINAHHYLIAKFASNGNAKKLEKYIIATDSINTYEEDLNVLISRGFIKGKTSQFETFKLIPTKKLTLNKISIREQLFTEFYEKFPQKVIRSNGKIDYLRTDKHVAMQIYTNTINHDMSLHKLILTCLDEEVKYRQRSGEMKFFKHMTSWLNSSQWENYQELIKSDNNSSNDKGYGQDIE